jgi:pyruvate carboxylase subunit B
MKYAIEVDDRIIEVEIDKSVVRVNGRVVDVRLGGERGEAIRRLVQGRLSRPFLSVTEGNGSWVLTSDGFRVPVTVLDARARAVRLAAGSGSAKKGLGIVKAPMPGKVLRILVEQGQAVEAGQGLIVVEAMKMENELKAAAAGTVKRLIAKSGDKVEKGTPLLELE